MKKFNSSNRTRFLASLVTLVAMILVWRLFSIQIVQGQYYADRATGQLAPGSNSFNRGSIFFSEKDGKLISAATLKSGFTLAINPQLLIKPADVYEKLNQLVPLNKENFLSKAAKTTDPYEELVPRLETNLGQQIQELALPGVIVANQRWRFYPGGERAAHVLGFMAYQEDEFTGLYGLEKQYDRVLDRGQSVSFADFFSQIFSSVTHQESNIYTENEGDIVTTIEPSVENFLETELSAIQTRWLPESLGGIIMDPVSGEILALAAKPTFNPGAKQSNIEVLQNPLIESVFEMGSVFKPLTLAAALDAGVIEAESTYYDSGVLSIDGKQIRNFDGRGRGQVSFQEVLNQSLNTGAVAAMEKLGEKKFYSYLLNYGLEEKTGIDLPNESQGLLGNLEAGRKVEYATASFGQGVAVTPLAITRAFAALANGGLIIKPRVVKKIVYQTRLEKEFPREVTRQVISEASAKEITQMLVRVVDEALQNGDAKNPRYQIAAKTGTAQLPAPTGGYESGRFLHSFFGYFPASQPRFLVFLYAVDPKGVTYASETLTAPFMNLAKFLLNYYQVPPDR